MCQHQKSSRKRSWLENLESITLYMCQYQKSRRKRSSLGNLKSITLQLLFKTFEIKKPALWIHFVSLRSVFQYGFWLF